MAIPSLADVKKRRLKLKDKPSKDYQRLLEGMGNYFLRTRPSAIDDDYISEVEGILNDLYVRANNEGVSSEVEEGILDALGIASELNRAINRNPSGMHKASFFRTTKRLGKTLILVSKFY